MRKVLNFVNDNKKIIIVVILIIVLVGTIYFINKSQNNAPASVNTAKSQTELKLKVFCPRLTVWGKPTL